jgi:hypothetical protein
MTIEYLARPPTDRTWFAVEVMRKEARKWDWVAFMIDVDPDAACADRLRDSRGCWVRIPGKHRNEQSAWDALHDGYVALGRKPHDEE